MPIINAVADDPLAPVSARFPLPSAYRDLPFSDAPPSGASTRAYALRVAGVPAPHRVSLLPPTRYCPNRQLAVTDDEDALPVYRMGFERTTIASKDGENDANEDWKPDL